MDKAFSRINWENSPSIATPLNEDNLNEGDAALDTIDDRVITLDLTKANQSDLLQTVKTVTYNSTTGVFVFTWWDGTTLNVDLNIEKIPVTFSMDANGVITMTTADGTTYTADVGSLIKQYSFVDSSEIDFTVTVDAQTGDKSVTASIKDGSITDTKLQPNYLADITTQATNASASATSALGSATNAHADAQLAQSYAVGTNGEVRTGDATDNAKYYKEQAQQAAADASAAAHVSTMTLSTNGIGRPDGTTITVDANGVFTATSGQVFIYPDPNVLPSASTANDKAIYLIDDPTASGADICTEWVVVTTNGVKTWKQIGDTSVDLSGYATTTQLNTKVNKTDLASIQATGTTNTTGSTIEKDTYFYLNGTFVRAKQNIAINATFTANSNYETVDDVLNTFEGGSGSGGHTIQNASGTNLTQRDTMQFKGGLSASDDSTNQKTVVTDEYPEIEWSVWDAMTPQEQEAIPDAIITNVPDTPDVPDGSTVTPTDDVQTLLACAGITDKSYNTLYQLLADTTTLQSVISSENAIDYLVRCKDWCGRALVPTMTSDTTPSGECIASGIYSSSYPIYQAFDGNDSTFWASENATVGRYLGYMFPSATEIKVIELLQTNSSNMFHDLYVQGSSDGQSWTNVQQFSNLVVNKNTLILTNATSYKYWRLYATSASGGLNFNVSTLQFYSGTYNLCDDSTFMSYVGLNNYASNTLLADTDWLNAICDSTYFESVLNVKVPVMTSNTTPSGECFASSISGANYDAFKAFDGNGSHQWEATGTTGEYLGYDFVTPTNIYKVVYTGHPVSASWATYCFGDFIIQGSNTSKTTGYDDIKSLNYPVASQGTEVSYILTNKLNNNAYRYIRAYCVTGGGGSFIIARELQFYGREDV